MSKKIIHRKIGLIKEMFKEYKDIENENRGIPVIGILFEIGTLNRKSEFFFTDKADTKEGAVNTTHSETKLIKYINSLETSEKFDIFVTLSPCKGCLKEIEDCPNIENIFFLLENTWNNEMCNIMSSIDRGKYKYFFDKSILTDPKPFRKLRYSSVHRVSKELVKHQNNWYKFREEHYGRKLKKLKYNEKTMSASLVKIKEGKEAEQIVDKM